MESQHDDDQRSSQGSALPWILDHLLSYPGSYELPLRTMYSLNAGPQTSDPKPSDAASTESSDSLVLEDRIRRHRSQTSLAATEFKAHLLSQIAQIPTQPSSLPPSFVASFLQRCFPEQLNQVDFPQALTALDYLKDLEARRRKDVVAALKRLGIDRDNANEMKALKKKWPGVKKWVETLEEKERKIEALYTQVYLGLRRWVRLPCIIFSSFANISDSYQRNVSRSLQQGELRRNAQYPLHACDHSPADSPTHSYNPPSAAQRLLSLHHCRRAERTWRS